jgi:hypothetical protein
MTQADVWRGLANIEAALAEQAKDSATHDPEDNKFVRRPPRRTQMAKTIVALGASAAYGVLITPWLVEAVAQMRPAMPFESIVLVTAIANLLFAPSLFAAGMLRRLGAATLGQIGMALPLLILTPFHRDVALFCVILATVAEGALALTAGLRISPAKRIFAAAVLMGMLSFSLNVFAHGLTSAQAGMLALLAASIGAALASAIPGACAAVLAGREHTATKRQKDSVHERD